MLHLHNGGKNEEIINYYHFDPNQIIINKTIAFTAVDLSFFDDKVPLSYVKYDQNDYFKIIDLFINSQTSYDINSVIISSISAYSSCEESKYGFQNFTIEFMRNGQNDKDKNTIYRIMIFPSNGMVKQIELSNETFHDNSAKIDIDNLNYSIDTAFSYIEKNGGVEIRKVDKDMCRVYISLSIDKNNTIWTLDYSQSYDVKSLISKTFELNDSTHEIIISNIK